MADVRLIDVKKAFGAVEVLKGVDLVVRRAERVVVCGPSGSGKSTLIRCVSGLETPNAGRITIDGVVVSGPGVKAFPLAGEVGMVFQQFKLFPHLTVLDNVMLAPVKVRGTPPAEARDLALALLERRDGPVVLEASPEDAPAVQTVEAPEGVPDPECQEHGR